MLVQCALLLFAQSLSVTSAFCFGANELLVTEKNGYGITWHTVFTPTGDSFPFMWSCIMSCVDSVFYFLIAWYISNKFPGMSAFSPINPRSHVRRRIKSIVW